MVQRPMAAVIRAKIARGPLSRSTPNAGRMANGPAQRCDGCDQPVPVDEAEVRFRVPRRGVALCFHVGCFLVWLRDRL
jgi:hypothetical protein